MLKFPSIESYKQCIINVDKKCSDLNIELPSLKFQGTVKLHGTHADLVYNKKDATLICQSRNRILTLDSDNSGFANYIQTIPQDLLKKLFEDLIKIYPEYNIFVLNGEWCGNGIQKNIGISQLQKMFIIYSVSIYNDLMEKEKYEYNIINSLKLEDYRIYNIFQFQCYEIEINFNDILSKKVASNKLGELTNEVEKECPVAKYFGISGIGEGIVWKCITHGYESSSFWFKVKGEQHSVSKVKTLAPIDINKFNKIQDFIKNSLTIERLEQGISYLQEMNNTIDIKSISIFIKWIIDDIFKEETDLISNEIKRKDLEKQIKIDASSWYKKYIKF